MNFKEFVEYCTKWQHDIYVREQVKGKWESIPLSQSADPFVWIRMWWDEDRMPVRILHDGD